MSHVGAAKLFFIGALGLFSLDASAANAANEVAALHAVDQAWVKAYNAGDADGVARLYDAHAMLLPPGAPGVNGRTAIRAFFAKDVAASPKDEGGKWLYVRDTWNSDGTPASAAETPSTSQK